MFRKAAQNPTDGQQTPLPASWIEETDISKSTNRFTSGAVYDEAGNVVQDTRFRDSNFWYDANGRMVKAAGTNNSNTGVSVYDASGMRVAEKVDGTWRLLVYDIGGKCVAEYGGGPAADEGGVKYVLQDWQGSVRAVVNGSGFVAARADFTAYGEEIGAGTGMRSAAQGFGAAGIPARYAMTERDGLKRLINMHKSFGKLVRIFLCFVSVALILACAVYVTEWQHKNEFIQTLESAHSKLRVGMSKAEVNALIGLPPDDVRFMPNKEGTKIILIWESFEHQGELHKKLGRTSFKGHYDLHLTFDEFGVLKEISGGVN